MNAASASLPAPDSPVTSTFASVAATRSARATASRLASDNATISITIVISKNQLREIVGRQIQTSRLAPQSLQVVKTSRLLVKNVHYKVTIVDQDPFGGLITFNPSRRTAMGLQLFD